MTWYKIQLNRALRPDLAIASGVTIIATSLTSVKFSHPNTAMIPELCLSCQPPTDRAGQIVPRPQNWGRSPLIRNPNHPHRQSLAASFQLKVPRLAIVHAQACSLTGFFTD